MGKRQLKRRKVSGIVHARTLIRQLCAMVQPKDWVKELQSQAAAEGVVAAVRAHDTEAVFEWLMWILSFQGVSDAAAEGYLEQHGNVTWRAIEKALAGRDASCPKLEGYWAFQRCGYRKGAATCAELHHLPSCPLPLHALRNGRLNQTAYSLYLFMRDVAGGDIVQWIDDQLGAHAIDEPLEAARQSLIDPLRNVYGVSDKVIGLALASLLIGAGADRPRWFEVGASFIVIDTLVHNFLCRTGVLRRLDAAHPYGPRCYQAGGCAEIIARTAKRIDARKFDPSFPRIFPRLIQHAIWWYCAEGGLGICNGNQIDDSDRCRNDECRLYAVCDRRVLNSVAKHRFST